MVKESTRSAEELGRILLKLHWQCWRADPPPLDVELSELVAVLPILIRSGSVGLVWPRLKGQLGREGAIALALEHAYQAQIAHNEVCQREIAESVTRLRAAGIEPVLVKGWAVSRLYPAPLVRPAGDIDLVVRHEEFARAKAILTCPETPTISVGLDLQDESTWNDWPGDGFRERSELIDVDGVLVQVPCTEDHLRLLCFHFLRHGAVRPSRLSDIALSLETRDERFDWDRCLGQNAVQANWVRTTLGLAHVYQGAEIGSTPVADVVDALPAWLMAAAGDRLRRDQDDPSDAFGQLAMHPGQLAVILRRRWPDPVSATLRYPGTFSASPRLPLQWIVYARQIAGYLRFRLAPQILHVRKRRQVN